MKDVILENHGELEPQVGCLDQGFVKLLDCMPRLIWDHEESADYAIAEAARTSYKRGTKTIADDKALIRYLMRHNHTSPFEMIEFKFHMKLPIFVARQMIRHRTASVNEMSGRYSEMPEEFFIPGELRVQSMVNTQGSEGLVSEGINDLIIGLMKLEGEGDFKFYTRLLEKGVAREQARIVLPLSTYTEWYWKIDLKNLLHFLNLRCDHHSQEEIQVYGNAILELIEPVIPYTISAWEDYSPYRGGMVLSGFEVQALRETILMLQKNAPGGYPTILAEDIKVENKLEQREWKEKTLRLGF